MNPSEYLKRVQSLPLKKRRIIFWSMIIVIGLILCSLYAISIRRSIKNFSIGQSLETIKFPDFKQGLENMPQFETNGKLNDLKNEIKETEKLIEENSAPKK